MNSYKTEQEAFWAGEFGTNYIERNQDEERIVAGTALYSTIFRHTHDVNSVIEFGSNIGINLRAIHRLKPTCSLSAIEINTDAASQLKSWGGDNLQLYNQSILDFTCDYQRDLVLIKGVLIHISPDVLPAVYDKLYETSKRYIVVSEYYNPTPTAIPYRGHENKLFKRDFAGELMDKHPDLKLIDYGFLYHRDQNFTYDDDTWFLLEKSRG